MRIISTLALSLLLLFGTPLYGQLRTNGLITHNAARSLGMERAWYLQVPMNPYSDRILDVYLHVNAAEASWSYEVMQGDDSFIFSDKDLDTFGRPLGREQARINANAFRLKLGGGDELIEHSVPKIYLSMLSDGGDVTLVNGETGQVYWTTHVGTPRHPAVGVCTNDEYTVVVTGVRIFVLRNTDGGIVQERMAQSLPSAGPVMVNKNIYVPSIQDRVEYYNLDRFVWTPGVLTSPGRAMTQPTIGGDRIAWPTDRGDIFLAKTSRPGYGYYKKVTIGIVTAPLAFQQPGQFVANCLDGYVYCFNEDDGTSIWRQSIGEPLVRQPVIVKDRVYIISQDKTCYCLSMKTGDVQWSHPDISQIISASGERLYALGRLGNLLVLNLQNGGHYTSLAAGKIDFVMVNAFTDRIYMGTRRGLIQCIHEIHHKFPMLHIDEVSTTDDADEGDKNVNPMNSTDPRPAQQEAPPITDPFAPKPTGNSPFK